MTLMQYKTQWKRTLVTISIEQQYDSTENETTIVDDDGFQIQSSGRESPTAFNECSFQ